MEAKERGAKIIAVSSVAWQKGLPADYELRHPSKKNLNDFADVCMEVGFSPDGSQPVLLHEVVARTGVASDLPVDTQMVQYPIYVLKGGETEVYNEIDFELYGMNNTQADCIRFMIWALSDINRIKTVCVDYQHVEKVYEATMISSKSLQYTPVEG